MKRLLNLWEVTPTLTSEIPVSVMNSTEVVGRFYTKKAAKLASRAPLMRNVLLELSLLLDLKGGFEIEVNAIKETIKGI